MSTFAENYYLVIFEQLWDNLTIFLTIQLYTNIPKKHFQAERYVVGVPLPKGINMYSSEIKLLQ